jgi:hypothetical protein
MTPFDAYAFSRLNLSICCVTGDLVVELARRWQGGC